MRARLFTVPFVACLGSGLLPAQDPAAAGDTAAAEARITVPSLLGKMRFLSHDLMEGRGVGTRADALTQLWIASRFEELGLRPGMGEAGYVQEVPIVGITAEVTQSLRVTKGETSITFVPPDEFTAVAGKVAETGRWTEADIVFVGYGITAPEQQWDDFKDVDVRGKVLLVMNDDPSSDPELFAGKARLYYGRWSYKYEEAARRGAIGAIVIHTTPSAGYPFQVIQATHGREAFWLPQPDDATGIELRSWCSEDAAMRIVRLGGFELNDLRAAAEKRDFRPVSLGVQASLATRNTIRTIRSGNVAAVLPGSDPKLRDEYVVVTAHFDHLGIGPEKKGDSIYNGALDNATGVAGMLALAEAAAALPTAPRRSILFVAVTAEESGLLGSQYFAENPPVPRKQMVANFNIDGLNIWGETKDIALVGHGKNSLTQLVGDVARLRGREAVADPETALGLFYRSDHFSFARIGVPSAYFKAGGDFLENGEGRRRLKASFTTTNYHQPSDELDPRWRLEGAVEDLRLMLACLAATANSDRAPTWTPGDEFERFR